MTRRRIVISTGAYPGPAIVASLRDEPGLSSLSFSGGPCEPVSPGTRLDKLLSGQDVNQVVVVGELGTGDLEWVLERIDGSLWLIVSVLHDTHGASAAVRQVRQEVALFRGATVFETPFVFGRGDDRTISPFTRALQRWRVLLCRSGDSRVFQPLHLDDLVAAIAAHGRDPVPGSFPIAGDESLPAQELTEMLAEIVGVRLPPVVLPSRALDASPVGKVFARLPIGAHLSWPPTGEVEINSSCEAFDWHPQPLPHRLEQAVREAAV